MRDSGSKQTDGAELIGLHEPSLELVAVRYVVKDNEPANLLEFLRYQRSDREVDDGLARLGRRPGEFEAAVAVARTVRNLAGIVAILLRGLNAGAQGNTVDVVDALVTA